VDNAKGGGTGLAPLPNFTPVRMRAFLPPKAGIHPEVDATGTAR